MESLGERRARLFALCVLFLFAGCAIGGTVVYVAFPRRDVPKSLLLKAQYICASPDLTLYLEVTDYETKTKYGTQLKLSGKTTVLPVRYIYSGELTLTANRNYHLAVLKTSFYIPALYLDTPLTVIWNEHLPPA